MSIGRQTNALLTPNNKAYGVGSTAPMLNPEYGGSQGMFADYDSHVSATPYVRRNLIAKLVSAPTLFNRLPDSDKWIRGLKAMIELNPKRWTGFSTGLELEWQEDNFGGAGEMSSAISNVTRGRATPTANYVDKVGRSYAHFWEAYIRLLMMDPDTKAPGIVALEQFRNRGTGLSSLDLLPDAVGFTVLFFEPDPTFTRIDKAYLTGGMQPKTAPPVEASRDKTAGGEMSEYDIEFTGITQYGLGVERFAQKILDDMNLTGSNPAYHPAFVDRVSADVGAAPNGYQENVDRMAGRVLVP